MAQDDEDLYIAEQRRLAALASTVATNAVTLSEAISSQAITRKEEMHEATQNAKAAVQTVLAEVRRLRSRHRDARLADQVALQVRAETDYQGDYIEFFRAVRADIYNNPGALQSTKLLKKGGKS